MSFIRPFVSFDHRSRLMQRRAKMLILFSSPSVQVQFALQFQMEDTTRLTSEPSIKLFIQRDYSEGTAVKFQERFPSELQGKINNDEFTQIIRNINEIYAEAEALSCKTFMENCCACLTGYLLLLCMPTHYEKCVKRAARYIEDENNRILNRNGIFMVDPMEKGLRCIEVCISASSRR